MCRWLAHHGAPQLIYDLLFSQKHSIVVQSLHSTMGAEATNGDGFGVGWYGIGDEPAQYRSVEPAWHDRNMKDLSKHIMSPTVFAHNRAASPGVSTVQQTNCHPFRYGQWLWMHNGVLRGFASIKRDLVLRVDSPSILTRLKEPRTVKYFSTWRSPLDWKKTRRRRLPRPWDTSASWLRKKASSFLFK